MLSRRMLGALEIPPQNNDFLSSTCTPGHKWPVKPPRIWHSPEHSSGEDWAGESCAFSGS